MVGLQLLHFVQDHLSIFRKCHFFYAFLQLCLILLGIFFFAQEKVVFKHHPAVTCILYNSFCLFFRMLL